ncbi:MAG: contractile injection system tape measure protein [Gammaproteobacteria bacterium]
MQRHVIKKQILLLEIEDPAQAQALQTEFARIYRERIVPLIDRYCTRYSSPDRIDRIESLQLDVGVIDSARLEQELVERVERQLDLELDPAPGRERALDHSNPAARTAGSQLELLQVFLRTGTLPWWADSSTFGILDRCLEQVLTHRSDRLAALLKRTLHRQDSALRRLINSFEDAALAALLSLLARPSEADLKAYADAMSNAMARSRLEAVSPSLRRRALWAGLYKAALADGRADFFETAWLMTAGELGIGASALRESLSHTPQLAALEKFQPALSGKNGYDQNTRAQAGMDEALARLLKDWSGSKEQDRLNTLEQLNRLLESLRGQADVPIALLTETLSLLQGLASGRAGLGELEAAMERLWAGHANAPKTTARKPRQSDATSEQNGDPGFERTPPLDLSFSDSDRLYIGNAGLVILWPFLERFFANLGLLHQRSLKDEAASQRACLLLQYLVDTSTRTDEYLLPLNKILSGMEPDAVFECDTEVSDDESEQCRLLLEAAIGHADILKAMSVAGFREAFLRRQGSLGRRDGVWLLQVERATHDVVLDRFPWSFEWLKLPWMRLPLRVEW